MIIPSSLVKDVIGNDGFYALLPEVGDDLPPVMGGVIAHVKQYFLNGILKFSAAGVAVGDGFAEVSIGNDLQGAQVVGLVIGLAGFQGVELMYSQRFFRHYSGIPYLVSVDHMRKEGGGSGTDPLPLPDE